MTLVILIFRRAVHYGVVVNIAAYHTEDPGSIPVRGEYFFAKH